ncbi:hypothetical protein DCS_08230 [Drechmeria coniospora]|uniref:Glycosyl transferase CAP10 domain-containing protein n=1 Tax=Drechmeria coniospora TaxID=98403 RepID=A0A151GGM9_DRECN|nr:hypothetical protein DCS_08230 [Drechmeria coniospora]KYK56260.1 hypothetical protein DCS_08230 [Drechmeria coniospora]
MASDGSNMRPVHFTTVTLLFCSAALGIAWPWRQSASPPVQLQVKERLDATRSGLGWASLVRSVRNVPSRARHLHRSLVLLLVCVVARSALFWLTIRTTQCSRVGIEAFLPLFSLFAELALPDEPASSSLARAGWPSAKSRLGRWLSSRTAYAVCASAWALSAMSALDGTRVETGTACPAGWRWTLTPLAQSVMCVLDAVALGCGARLRAREVDDDADDVSESLAAGLLFAAGCVFLLSFPSWLSDSGLYLAFSLSARDIWQLCAHSLVAATAILSALHLLRDFPPTLVALIMTEVGLFGHRYPKLHVDLVALVLPSTGLAAQQPLLAALLSTMLWRLAASLRPALQTQTFRILHKWLLASHVGVVLFAAACETLFPTSPAVVSVGQAVEELVFSAKVERDGWLSRASVSTSLPEAVAEYTRRHGMPPPPNFDKWYAFAVEKESAIVDDFGQIYRDTRPFWGVEPSVVRGRTMHLLENPMLGMGGLSIENGTVDLSPHIPGTHRWMAESFRQMIEPFAAWLPDMVLAMNLDDECRVAVPFREREALEARAADSTSRLLVNSIGGETTAEFTSAHVSVPASTGPFPEPTGPGWGLFGVDSVGPHFTDNVRRPIYPGWVAAACPPGSAARTSRWWDWSSLCVACMEPHSRLTSGGPVLSNATLAHSLCHQPDVARLDGFAMSPSSMVGTNTLFPVFSQGRVGGFSDLLVPSPWDYSDKSAHVEAEDVHWVNKTNGLYWRGSATDGFAAHGVWPGFLRARFVHEAYEVAMTQSGDPSNDLSVNASYVDVLPKCDPGDCADELASFRHWGSAATDSRPAEADRVSAPLPFKESWTFRHLMDMDGAGFSGRFRSFLQSHSLVYRAALFRTWYDERIFAWHDYVPVDVRLGRGFWATLRYLAGVSGIGAQPESGDQGASDKSTGERTARKIASQGRRSALAHLRKEDMQVYMFRLLLEWGRLVSDDREKLAYSVDGQGSRNLKRSV